MGRGKRKRKQEKPKDIPFRKGQRIVLRRGEGPKCKYNGVEASVLECPKTGTWMTVSHRAIIMKWRKKDCISKSKSAEKQAMDRIHLQLNEDILTTIFSFVIAYSGCAEEQLEEAQEFHATLTAVSKTWKNVCNNNMTTIFGPLHADLRNMHCYKVVGLMHWMIKHRVAIDCLLFEGEYGDILFLEKLFNTCDTSKLDYLSVHIYGHKRYFSLFVTEAYQKYIDETNGDDPSLQDMCKALDVPYSSSRPTIRQLHDTIALNCPSIHCLIVNLPDVKLKNEPCDKRGVWDCVSRTLFSLTRVDELILDIEFCEGVSTTVNWIIESLDNLGRLTLYHVNRMGSEEVGSQAICIKSKKLWFLDVSDFENNCYLFGDLPCLDTLHHNGPSSGIVPDFIDDRQEVTRRFFAREARMHRLNLPPKCFVRFQGSGGFMIEDWMRQKVTEAAIL